MHEMGFGCRPRAETQSPLSVDLARPEDGTPPSLMLEYQKSRRRRTALGPGDSVGVRGVERKDLSPAMRRARRGRGEQAPPRSTGFWPARVSARFVL
jgi:hypothetical protein